MVDVTVINAGVEAEMDTVGMEMDWK